MRSKDCRRRRSRNSELGIEEDSSEGSLDLGPGKANIPLAMPAPAKLNPTKLLEFSNHLQQIKPRAFQVRFERRGGEYRWVLDTKFKYLRGSKYRGWVRIVPKTTKDLCC